jgi:ribonucleoside-diphosphate reductase alpha chain
MFRRVAAVVAEPERSYDPANAERWQTAYYHSMAHGLFLPNSPTLMNAGTRLAQLAACFVLPVEDSIADIFAAVRNMALIHQSGGGTGFSFSHLRPEGDVAHEVGEAASGPVSFMRVFDIATDVVKQGGRRRGANMGVLSVSHPDILEFVHVKDDAAALRNFNLSVAVPDAFLDALRSGAEWPLVNPRTGAVVGQTPAAHLWGEIAPRPGARRPGSLHRRDQSPQPHPALGAIEAPPILHLAPSTSRGRWPSGFDWDHSMSSTSRRPLLDNVIDIGHYPLHDIARVTRANRKIGPGSWACQPSSPRASPTPRSRL